MTQTQQQPPSKISPDTAHLIFRPYVIRAGVAMWEILRQERMASSIASRKSRRSQSVSAQPRHAHSGV
ncbi:hypothetical protein [Auritidibacter ignavus]|uniref:hypothetical protein n=1 Tax=Auritidibacter ignavus TaxID=678932 RepID=UPI00109C5FFA|nr:hypothetical protein [Auritidibacter ignavus]